MMSIGKWFQSILSEFKSHLNQEGSVSLTSGISFIVLVLVMISIFLKPQSPVPGHSTQFVSTLQEQIEVEVPDQRRAEVGPSSIARGGISSSTQVTTPSPKPYDQNAAARLAEQERAERRREFVHRAENLYDQGRLDDALEQVALLGSEESAIQLKRRIQLLRAFLERAETITCVRYLNEVKSVHVDIAQHPLVTTQTQRCQKSTPPRSLR